MNQDRLIASLQSQARGYDPEPPVHLQRRVLDALAQVRRAEMAPRMPFLRVGWAVLATAAAVALAVLLWRPAGPAPAPHRDNIVKKTTPAPSVPNPIALAHQFLDDPMEGELRALMQDLSRTTDTVTRILPAPKTAKTNDKALQGAANSRSSQA